MSTKNLKFIHLGSDTVAKGKSFDAGSIIFEPKSGRIAVQGATTGDAGLEYYGGGRIADATFEDKILTLSFNDGSDAITLDFSDTASAEGVNKILGVLRTDVNALKKTVGDAGSGLVKDVATNAANIAKNATAIQANANAIDAIKNESTGILANAKKYTDDEIVKLRGGADGYKGTLKDLDGAIKSNDTDITNLQALHAAGTSVAGKATVADEINAKVGAIDTDTVKAYVDNKVKTVTDNATALTTRVETLEGTVGDSTKGLVKQVNDNEAKLNTLIGTDTGKSARKIANEELAKQLIPEGAAESLNTLQEIAAWIQDHPGDASAMNAAIKALQTTVGKPAAGSDAATGLHKDIADNAAAITANATAISDNAKAIRDNDTDIAALQALHAKDGQTMKSVATEVADGIKGLGTVTKTNDESNPKTADVVVTVTTTEGKVSAVAVDASVLDRKVTDEVKRATDKETEIRADLGNKDDAASTGASATAFGRIKALEEAQTSGSLMWSDWQD